MGRNKRGGKDTRPTLWKSIRHTESLARRDLYELREPPDDGPGTASQQKKHDEDDPCQVREVAGDLGLVGVVLPLVVHARFLDRAPEVSGAVFLAPVVTVPAPS